MYKPNSNVVESAIFDSIDRPWLLGDNSSSQNILVGG